MKKRSIIMLIVAIAMISTADAQIYCVPMFKNGPYGSYVTLTPQDGTPPYQVSINGGEWSSNLSFFALYNQQYNIVLRDQNGLVAEIGMNRNANYFRTNFDPSNMEIGEQEISINAAEFIVQDGVVLPLTTGDTIIARPASGWLRIIQDPLSMIDTLLVFDTIVIIDTITVVEIDPIGTNANVSLYPNPTVGQLIIECPSVIREVAIFNTLGQQVVTSYNLGNKGSMDLTTLPKGTYTMRITLNDGRDSVYKLVRN